MTNHAIRRLLVVDVEPDTQARLSELLRGRGYDMFTSNSYDVGCRLDQLAPDLILAALNTSRTTSADLLARLWSGPRQVPVILLSPFDSLDVAVEAIRQGAADFLSIPVDPDQLLLSVERALTSDHPPVSSDRLRGQLHTDPSASLEGLTGESRAMQELYALVRQVAPANATVLLTGESGTGKGELARVIHSLGPRCNGPFVAVHCAALAQSVLESELFGHERGSFTGADRRRLGRFEQANGGTLFLDEIGEVSPAVQVKLLNVLQDRTLERVGGNAAIPLDVRVIAATNRDLPQAIRAGTFREDLYYRLNVVQLQVPPLREREGDVLLLAEAFLRRFAAENDKSIRGFSSAACARLKQHEWPGNVRELENAVERAVIMCEGPQIEADHLPSPSSPPPSAPLTGIEVPGASMADVERFAILRTLEAVGGSTTRAAEILQISVRTLQYRLHDYGMSKRRGRPPSDAPKSRA